MPTPHSCADLNLLFGILALQLDFISREQLVGAMNAWVLAKHKALGDILKAQGALDVGEHELLSAMVQAHLKKHGDDAEKSLAAVPLSSGLKGQITSLADPEVQASLGHLRGELDPYATRSFSVGEATSAGTRFRILRPHAKGGLGEVFVAEDMELHREVALKEIQGRHADHAGSRGRFVLEAEITGGLEHPGIVPVYGLGAYPDGRPFYAMRFIKGDNLKEAISRFHNSSTDYAHLTDERQPGSIQSVKSVKSADRYSSLDFRKLLGRFIDVCNAVAYAHSRGVLHRDLKPGNIMLGKFGETLVVDWGLAKVRGEGTGAREKTEPDAQARDGEAPLRPASGSGVAETVAGTAIGTPAFMSAEQASGTTAELGPATDIYSLGATLYTLLTNRTPISGSDTPEILRKAQRGDAGFAEPGASATGIPTPLVAICKKAMSPDPRGRYATPLALAEDLEHWLADEPVQAAPDPLLVRIRRWTRKHPGPVSGIAAAVLVGVVGLVIGAVVLGEKNQLLSNANAQLDAANAGLKTSNEKERAASALALHTLTSMNSLAVGYDAAGKADLALPLFEETLKLRKGKLGPDHPDTLHSMNNLAVGYQHAGKVDLALPLYKETLELTKAKLGPDHPDTLNSMNNLAYGYKHAGKLELALPLFEETLKLRKAKLGRDHPDTLTSMSNLAYGYEAAAKVDLALPLFQEALKLRKAKLGPDHPDTRASMNNLALGYHAAGKLDLALPLYEEALKLMKAKLGPDHPVTLTSMHNLAHGYEAVGKLDLALPLFQDAAAGIEKRRFQHEYAQQIVRNLMVRHERLQHFDQAEAWRRKWLAVVKERSGADSLAYAGELATLGLNLLQQKKAGDAEAMVRECLALLEKKAPAVWSTFSTQSMLGGTLLAQKKYADAEPLLKAGYEGMKACEKTIPPQARARLTEAAERLVQLYEATDRKDEAKKWTTVLAALEGKLDTTVHDPARTITIKNELSAAASAVIFQVRLKANVIYVIDMVSPDAKALDPYLVLQDSQRTKLAEDDDSGGNLNARMVFRAPADGVYRLRATSFNGGRGPFTLTIRKQD
jgi:serine/threonine protein kinase